MEQNEERMGEKEARRANIENSIYEREVVVVGKEKRASLKEGSVKAY